MARSSGKWIRYGLRKTSDQSGSWSSTGTACSCGAAIFVTARSRNSLPITLRINS